MRQPGGGASAAAPSGPAGGATPAPEVLIVEPQGALARRLAGALAGLAVVEVVPTARAARAALITRAPDLLVTELELPDADGLGFIARVAAAPALRHVLILVVTRRAAVRDKIAAFQAGADDYLVKPVDAHEFARHVRAVIRFRRVLGP
jgi:DNA-binding response OmpR family regulator